MARKPKGTEPRIVAELGRPETPEETAERKATASRNRRARQTINNLWFSLLATLGIVVVIVLLVPRADGPARVDVDYATVADQAAGSVSEPLVVPQIPPVWRSNAAELRTRTADGVDEWYVGFITPSNEYIGFSQGIDANSTWVLQKVRAAQVSGAESIGGLDWTVYDNRTAEDPGLAEYSMSTDVGGSSYVLYGSADANEFRTMAESVAAEVEGSATDD
ncbi:DUF4245 domain-containing protein [Planctomonas psychrotolerans]|uniref:DUF4245 domain-containing protein n=1 Tax=Planctomonas psychrotolerans TaxID=2528712 RepID=UPI001239B638|nr:DUF4245 domain-containing protein [Planctomonas psychrotolerans]